jgi:hypothetical protein
MIRKRMVGMHVLLGNLHIASLSQGFCQCLVVRRIAVIGFKNEKQAGPLKGERNSCNSTSLGR